MPCFSGNGTQSVAYFVSSEQVYGVVGNNVPQDVLWAIFGRPTTFSSPQVNNVGSSVVPQVVAIPSASVDLGTIIDPAVITFVTEQTQQVGTVMATGVPSLVTEEDQDVGTNVGVDAGLIVASETQNVKFFVDTNVCC